MSTNAAGASAKPAKKLRPGATIKGRYKLLVPLGKGGMGSVFAGEDLKTGQKVAVKVLQPDALARPDLVARFEQEGSAAQKTIHPNIVSVIDGGREAETGALYMVLELLDGDDLRRKLDLYGRLSPDEALKILVPVMSGLAEAHAQGIIHRDIKPENIVLTRTPLGEVPKLIDFGISKVLGEDGGGGHTRTGYTVGTPQYMSPEQVRGDRTIDERADVWSVGVVFYECVTGKCPFRGSDFNILVQKILHEPAAPIQKLAPEVSPQLAAVIHRALDIDRHKRFQSMAEFLRAVEACPNGAFARDYGETLVDMPLLGPSLAGKVPSAMTPSTPPLAGAAPRAETQMLPAKDPSPRKAGGSSAGTDPAKEERRAARRRQRNLQRIALFVALGVLVAAMGMVGWLLGSMHVARQTTTTTAPSR